MKQFIIASLPNNGYWSQPNTSYKGILFATRYDSQREAEEVAEKLAPETDHILAVFAIFDRERKEEPTDYPYLLNALEKERDILITRAGKALCATEWEELQSEITKINRRIAEIP